MVKSSRAALSSDDKQGLTTLTALKTLHEAVRAEINDEEETWKQLGVDDNCVEQQSSGRSSDVGISWASKFRTNVLRLCGLMKVGLSHSVKSGPNESSLYRNCPWVYCHWYSLSLFGVAALCIAGGFMCPAGPKASIVLCGCMLLLFLGLNIVIAGAVHVIRKEEMLNKAKIFCKELEDAGSRADACSLVRPSLFAPASESIHLQWTYRDGVVANIPWILLVEGDVILLRPGREAPCRCREIGEPRRDFVPGQLFLIQESGDKRVKDGVKRFDPILCRVLETPVSRYFRTCFRSARRTPTLFENELRKVLHVLHERMLLPAAAVFSFIVISVRIAQFSHTAGSVLELILIESVVSIVPLLGIFLPAYLTLANLWNLAGLISGYQRENISLLGAPPSAETTELFVEEGQVPSANYCFSCEPCSVFRRLLCGDSLHLPFSANLVHVLGNVTSISVVDKKGLLSWPNPTPEKIFFVRDVQQNNSGISNRVVSRGSLCLTQGNTCPEVLALTHDPDQAFSFNFDDLNWSRHLPNLKPIGLNILLNSCRLDEEYMRFLDHVHVISEWVPRTIAVVNRRCCCHLAKLLGFDKEETLSQFHTNGTLAGYKKVAGEASVPGLTKHRTPLPNVFASRFTDSRSVGEHLMGQGTADLLLEMCSHCWTGRDVAEFPRSLRRKVLDFYQRNSMTSYCLAFSYRPVVPFSPRDVLLPDVYMSWPQKQCNIDEKKPKTSSKVEESPVKSKPFVGALSMEALDVHETEEDELNLVNDSLLSSDHIFLGMVTLQYQAKPDVVRLLEHLDKACIRFVHFSKENELRSRIFAEKMGLEAGWNCHVSLASEGSTDLLRSQTVPGSTGTTTEENLIYASDPFVAKALERWNSVPNNIKVVTATVASNKVENQEEEFPRNRPVYTLDNNSEDCSLDLDAEKERSPLLSERTSRTSGGDNADVPNSSAYVFPNRAQLPKGVDNVRPHLENNDNVPLLVNLFTDCDHVSTREMLKIMQEYGEIVLVMGSSLNFYNADIFCQADASVAIEPLHPSRCVQEPLDDEGPSSSMELANMLTSLPSCLNVPCGSRINLLEMLGFARHRLALLRTSLVFLFSANISLYLVRVISLLLFLPPLFDLPQILFWVILILPVIGFSLCVSPDSTSESLKMSTPKNENWVPKKLVQAFCVGFVVKFLPSIGVVILLFSCLLPLLCRKIPQETCWWYFTNQSTMGSWAGWDAEYKTGLVVAQQICSVLITLYLCVISMGFVHVRENLWSCSPMKNTTWVASCFLCLLAHIIYSVIVFKLYEGQGDVRFYFDDVPWFVYVAGVLWIVPLTAGNELYKRNEIKLYRRVQRRRGLSFGTKLGLNSPW